MQGQCDDMELTWIQLYTSEYRVGQDVRFSLMSYRRAAIRANVEPDDPERNAKLEETPV